METLSLAVLQSLSNSYGHLPYCPWGGYIIKAAALQSWEQTSEITLTVTKSLVEKLLPVSSRSLCVTL